MSLLRHGTRARVPAHITESTSRDFGLEVEVRRSSRPKQDSNQPSGVPENNGMAANFPHGIGPLEPGNRNYREVIPPGKIGSEEKFDMQMPPPQYVDTVQHYETEQNDPKLHGPMAAMRSAERGVPFNTYGSFQPRSAPMPRAAQDDLYLEGPGKNAADPRMQDRDSSELFPGRRETVDNCDLYGKNVAGVLHNNDEAPDYALRQSDAEAMQRSMKGATTSRSAGMAHQTAEKEMAKTQTRKYNR